MAVVVALALAAADSSRAAGYSSPDWWPLRGENLVGCARDSTGPICGGNYHSWWAIDIEGPQGQPVYASGAGLAKVHTNSTGCSGYGRSVVVEHGGATKSLYAHLSNFSAALAASPGGVWVDHETVIGYVGHTGFVSNCSYNHLHYEETTNGSFGSSATDPGALKGCIGSSPVSYPTHWGRTSWSGLPGHTFRGRHDGPSCALPGDGGLVRTPDGRIHRIVGGAPLWISRCDYTNGCAGVVNVADLSGYRPYPRDGALLGNVDNGGIYRFAGGAPLWISSCSYAPGCDGVVEVDAHPLSVNDHIRAHPADGTLVANHRDGGIYRFAGGAPLWISSCDYAPGCNGVVALDGGTFDRNGAISGAPRMRAHPADGSYLRIRATGDFLRAAGGAALRLSECGVLDGACAGAVAIDNGTLQHAGALSGASRLRAAPADGTTLHGRPSDARWTVTGGRRFPAPGDAPGVQVNDSTVDTFAPEPAPAPGVAPPSPPTADPPSADAVLTGLIDQAARLRLRRLARRGRATLRLEAPVAGTVTLAVFVRPRARRAAARLLVRGTTRIRTPGASVMRITLTRRGRRLARHSRRLRVEVVATFARPNASAVRARRLTVLHR
jgi:hypothetical protein